MQRIEASVGRRGENLEDDVLVVQQLLNPHAASLGLPTLVVDGDFGTNTLTMILAYQRMVLRHRAPDGRIDPDGVTFQALRSGQAVQSPSVSISNPHLSGAAWWHANQSKFPNSNKLIDLVPPFRHAATAFVQALVAAGATVRISSTLRHKSRAYLMHYCWKIAQGTISPGAVPPHPGVEIEWDHGSLAKSKTAAQQMKSLFGMRYIAALNSIHIEGRAIDMTIGWSGTIHLVDADGRSHSLTAPRNGATNTQLHRIGASYGARKLVGDDPHWSATGH